MKSKGNYVHDLGPQPPGTEREVVLSIESTPSARGRSLRMETRPGTQGLFVTASETIELHSATLTLPIRVRMPNPFLEPAEADLVLTLADEPAGAWPPTLND